MVLINNPSTKIKAIQFIGSPFRGKKAEELRKKKKKELKKNKTSYKLRSQRMILLYKR